MADDLNKKIEKYGLKWNPLTSPLAIEFYMIRCGGKHKKRDGTLVGEGMEYHFKEAIKLTWPGIVWHKWIDLFVGTYLKARTMPVLGPASSGKTFDAAICLLTDYYAWEGLLTGICCSTTKERLEDRVWGEIKKYHRQAKKKHDWLPGNLIEGRQRIVTDGRDESTEGRDFRNGLVGVACLSGGSYVGLSNFIGLKNKRVRLLADELSLLPRAFVDSISNLDKNPDFKAVGLGNPKDTTDALGVMAEPAAHLGGWEGGVDQTPVTKTWDTRRPGGICVQFVGSDSPNLDGKLGIPILNQGDIDRDVAFYGKESLWYSMMNQGMMPRGQGAKRVVTRQLCDKFGARTEPVWANSKRTRIAFLDAAYRGVGGDRCVFGQLDIGEELVPESDMAGRMIQSLTTQDISERKNRQVIALVDMRVVPINAGTGESAEDQIVQFVMAQCREREIAPENFFFDSGMRTALVQAFSRVWSNQVQSVDFGGSPSERFVSHDIRVKCKDYYKKFVTELWFNIRHTIESGQMRGLTDDVIGELSAREWGMTAGNKIEVEPKDRMKEKTGRSPDLADALACGLFGALQRGFVIKRLKSDAPESRRDDRWKREFTDKGKAFWKTGQLVAA